MIANLSNLVRLKKSQIKPAAEMLARAFQDDPLFAFFIPDASERKNKSPSIFQVMIHYGLLYGETYATSPNLEGVAVWLPSEKAHMTLWGDIRSGGLSLFLKLGIKSVLRQLSYSDYGYSVHKRHAPFRHWLLQPLGIDPMFQGKGYGSTLLKAMFARIDQEHLPCYLDTQTEKNVSFYQQHGFKVVEEFTLPGTKFNNWAMLREV